MAETSKIEWTDATWNPITGCSVVSPGCTNCYAMKLAGTRLQHHPSRAGLTTDSKAGPVWNGQVRLNEEWLTQPLKWKRPRMIFVCAHGDLFHESVPDEWIDRVFAVMALAPQHTFQVLTKRTKRMREYVNEVTRLRIADAALERDRGALTATGHWPLPNVWLGVSVEDQTRADERIPDLLDTPAAVRFISAEPLLGPVDLEQCGTLETIQSALPAVIEYEMRGRARTGNGSICDAKIDAVGNSWSSLTFYKTPDHMGGFSARSPRAFPRIDWVIVGGESGPDARPMHPDWARSLRDQCASAGVPFFFKQWGAWRAWLDRDNDDPDWRRDYSRLMAEGDGVRWLNLAGGCGFHGKRFHVMGAGSTKRNGRLLDGVEHNAMPEAR